MEPLLERLGRGEVVLADGAMGTMLFREGLEPGECPERLNITRPAILGQIARRYLDAGAGIVQTNTFGASPMKLAEYGLDKKAEEINTIAVLEVRKAVDDRAYISGSCGPSARLLKPYGDAEPEELTRGFERQIRALVEAGVDMICVETMTDLNEAVLAVRAARHVSTRTTVMATMTFDKTPGGFFTIMGAGIGEAATALQEAGADVIGSNCGNGIVNMIEIAREFKANSSLPVIIQSNAGRPELSDGTLVYSETPDFFAEKTADLIDAGVSVIGGCCGTTPEHIRAMRKTLDSRV